MKITMLGSGSSSGVPQIGCACETCRSDNPRNKRTRVSVLVETGGKKLLIDTSPDLRQQALANGITAIDAILYTHDHADHIHGIDDVRAFNIAKGDTLKAYADAATTSTLSIRFPYIFKPKPEKIWYRPSLELIEIPTHPLREFKVEGVTVRPVLQGHAATTSLGFRIGNFAYSTDVNEFSEESFSRLEGLDVWIVDCLRYTPSYTHSRLELTLEWIKRLKPKLAVLTHMAHEMEYERLLRELPEGIIPGYDGLVLEIPEP